MMVPDSFESIARIFFPFVGEDIVRDGRVMDNKRITWAEMARRHGRVAHALMEEETICAGSDGEITEQGVYQVMSMEQHDALWAILTRHTANSAGWFLLWDGFGDVDPQPFSAQVKIDHYARSYHLLRGPFSTLGGFSNAPSYIWPDDRSWCLCRDTDWSWAYVAGSASCIAEVVGEPVLDAYPTEPANPARSGMDVIHDPQGGIPRRF